MFIHITRNECKIQHLFDTYIFVTIFEIFDTEHKYKSKGRPLLCHVSIVIVNKHIATADHMHELAVGEFQETVFIFLFYAYCYWST